MGNPLAKSRFCRFALNANFGTKASKLKTMIRGKQNAFLTLHIVFPVVQTPRCWKKIPNHKTHTQSTIKCSNATASWQVFALTNRPFSNSLGWTGSSMKWSLMRANLFKCKLICLHYPPFHAKSSLTARIRNLPIPSWAVQQMLIISLCAFTNKGEGAPEISDLVQRENNGTGY